MKIYKSGLQILMVICACSFISCEEMNTGDVTTLVNQINNYCDKVDASVIKKSFSKMIVKSAPIGNNTLNADEIVDGIMNDTRKYLKDVANLISSGSEKNGLNKSLKNSFNLYKKTVEEDIPKLSNGGNTKANLNTSEADIENILSDVKRKNNEIIKQLQKIEKEALSKTDDMFKEN